jgi:hypothetical protein
MASGTAWLAVPGGPAVVAGVQIHPVHTFAVLSMADVDAALEAHKATCQECGLRAWQRFHYCREALTLQATWQAWHQVAYHTQPDLPPNWWMKET